MNLPTLGKLIGGYYYDGMPLLQVYDQQNGTSIFAIWIDIEVRSPVRIDCWMVVVLPTSVMNDYMDKQISLLEAFENSIEVYTYKDTSEGAVDLPTVEKKRWLDIDAKYHPKPTSFHDPGLWDDANPSPAQDLLNGWRT